MQQFKEYIPIPEELWSFETGAPMQCCALCDCDLFEPGRNYLVEKAFKGSEVIFEYAMCLDCRDKLQGELSLQSRKLIQNYFEEHVDLEARRMECLKAYGLDYSKWVQQCLVKHKPRSECTEFQVYGWCVDRDLVFTGFPYMLSSDCIDDLLELISEESMGAINDFSEKIFGVDLPKDLLVI
jgi:hypothetical protein